MESFKNQFIFQALMRIKQIINEDNNGDRFIIRKSHKNDEFIRTFQLSHNSIKDIILGLSVDDYLARTRN